MLEQIAAGVTLAALAYASYTDLKERIVPDWLSYGMIILGIFLHAAQSFLLNDYSIVTTTILVTIITFVVSLGLWKIGFWAGGDVKLFTAIAAANPFNYFLAQGIIFPNEGMFATINLPIFPLTVFLYSVFAMLPVGLLFASKKILSDKQLKEKTVKDLVELGKKTFFFALLAAGINSVSQVYEIHFLIGLALLFGALIFARKFLWIFGIVFFGAGVFLRQETIFEALFLLAIGIGIELMLKLYSLSKSGDLAKKVNIEKLEEGMIPAFTLVEKNGQITEWKPSIKSILNNAKNNLSMLKDMFTPKGRVIVFSSNADGLSNEQIKELQDLAQKKLIPQTFLVKESTPFVPAVFLAFLVLHLSGDFLWSVIF